MNAPSTTLITQALRGDEAAFAELVRQSLPALYRFVLTIVRDRDLAEDIVQETWIKIWKHRARYDPDHSFTTWSYTIAKRTAFDALKKKQPLAFAALSEEAERELLETRGSDETDIALLLDRAADTCLLDRALAQIAPMYRVLLTLHYREDLRLHEVAAVLGDSYNTVKSRHQRALAKLRQALEKETASVTLSRP